MSPQGRSDGMAKWQDGAVDGAKSEDATEAFVSPWELDLCFEDGGGIG